MSTEPAAASTAEPISSLPVADPKPERGFRRAFLATVGVLAAASVVLAFAGFWQGPRLAVAAVDAEAATRLVGSRLVLELNQPIERVEGGLRLTPAVPAELEIDDDRLLVSFERPLPYDEEVTVVVDGVVGTAQPVPATIEYRFSTPDEPVYTLVRRSPNGDADVVRRTTVGGGSPKDVLEAPRLQAFAVAAASDVVAAVAIEDDGTNTLRLAGIGAATQTVGLPEPGVVRKIGASTTQPLIAFTFSGTRGAGGGEARYADALFTLDVSGQNAAIEPLLGPGGSPLAVADWRFVPGTASLVVQDRTGALFIVDALGIAPAMPLGSHAELRGLLPGSTDLVVADPDGGALIDLADGEERPNVLPIAELPDTVYPGRVQQLDADGTHLLELLLVTGAGGADAETLVARVDATGTDVLFATGSDRRLLSSCVSPNGRLLAVETASGSAASDAYPNAPSPLDRLTTIVDIGTGRTVLVQNGGFSAWCA